MTFSLISQQALRNHQTLTFTLAQVEKRKPAITSYNTILPEVVPNAIYIGDLPFHIDENTLRMIFSHYGAISNVDIRKNFSSELFYFPCRRSRLISDQRVSLLLSSSLRSLMLLPWPANSL